jgi:hypothetical protein
MGHRWAVVPALVLLAGCGGAGYKTINVTASEGSLTGHVYFTDGTAAAGVPVSVNPPSLESSSTTATATDGSFTISAPAGAVTLTFGGALDTRGTLSATCVSNTATSVGAMMLLKLSAATTSSAAAPTVTASVSPTSVANGGAVTVTATAADTNAAANLTVMAYAAAPDGTLLASAAVSGGTASLTLPNATGAALKADVRVSAGDTVSGVTATADAGTVTVGP